MDIVCKEKLNTIFWRHDGEKEWNWAGLDEVISTYEDEPYTELSYWQPVRREGSEEILYHVIMIIDIVRIVVKRFGGIDELD